jgi:hypothetical protein
METENPAGDEYATHFGASSFFGVCNSAAKTRNVKVIVGILRKDETAFPGQDATAPPTSPGARWRAEPTGLRTSTSAIHSGPPILLPRIIAP